MEVTGLRDWTAAQIAALAFGAWWTLNGILALIEGDSSLAALAANGEVSFLGISIAVNGWHALFHLSTGLAGIAVCANPRAARAYALAAGWLYLAVAASGLLTGSKALAVISVDTLGSVIHVGEGLLVLTAGMVSPARPLQRQSDY